MHYAELNQAWAELTQPGAPFEIETIEVRGAPIRAFKNAPPNVRALWLSTAAFAERDYLVYGDERITYAEAHRQVASIANWMFSRGVRPGDRVAIAMRNYPEWMLIYWACACTGVAAVGMNAWWTAPEMAYGLADSAPKILFADAERIARLEEQPGMLGEALLVAVRAEPPAGAVAWSDVIAHGGALPDVAIDPDDDLCIFYTSGIITSIAGDFFVDKPASCGRAMPTFETKVVGDDGQVLGPGQPGELWVRGSSVIKGYINRPEATAESLTDGWLHTGDVAWLDEEGFIYLVDRKKDMVLRGGENIYCAEVESTIHQHPAVAECCVFGVPDDRLGEEVGAAILLRTGETVNAYAIREHCIALIARHKAPRYVWLLDSPIPRNANGKFLKRELRETLSVEDAA